MTYDRVNTTEIGVGYTYWTGRVEVGDRKHSEPFSIESETKASSAGMTHISEPKQNEAREATIFDCREALDLAPVCWHRRTYPDFCHRATWYVATLART